MFTTKLTALQHEILKETLEVSPLQGVMLHSTHVVCDSEKSLEELYVRVYYHIHHKQEDLRESLKEQGLYRGETTQLKDWDRYRERLLDKLGIHGVGIHIEIQLKVLGFGGGLEKLVELCQEGPRELEVDGSSAGMVPGLLAYLDRRGLSCSVRRVL